MSLFRKSALIFIAVVLVLTLALLYLLRSSFLERTVETALERMFDAPVRVCLVAAFTQRIVRAARARLAIEATSDDRLRAAGVTAVPHMQRLGG